MFVLISMSGPVCLCSIMSGLYVVLISIMSGPVCLC